MAGLRDHRLGDVDLAVENVARDFEIGGPGRAGEAFARRHRDHVGDALGRAHAGRELGDRPHDVDMRQVLERAHHVLRQRALAADMEDRAFRAEGGGDAGHGVRAARPGRGHDAAELAGLARIAVGGVGRDLLVPHVDDADALVDAAVIDVDDVAAAQGEDRVDPSFFSALATRWPPETMFGSRLFCFSVSSAVVVSRFCAATSLAIVSSILPLPRGRSG